MPYVLTTENSVWTLQQNNTTESEVQYAVVMGYPATMTKSKKLFVYRQTRGTPRIFLLEMVRGLMLRLHKIYV